MTTPRKLKSGADAHPLTTEERQRGAATTNQKKREAKMSDAEWFRTKIEQDRDAFYESARTQALEHGDWRAWQFMHERGFGKPKDTVQLEGGFQVDHLAEGLERFAASVVSRAPAGGADEAPK